MRVLCVTHRVAALPLISMVLVERKLVAMVNVYVKAHTSLNTLNTDSTDSSIKCWRHCILAFVYV